MTPLGEPRPGAWPPRRIQAPGVDRPATTCDTRGDRDDRDDQAVSTQPGDEERRRGDPIEGRDETAQRDGRLRDRRGEGAGRPGRPALRRPPLRRPRRRGDAPGHGGRARRGHPARQALRRARRSGSRCSAPRRARAPSPSATTRWSLKGAKPLPASDWPTSRPDEPDPESERRKSRVNIAMLLEMAAEGDPERVVLGSRQGGLTVGRAARAGPAGCPLLREERHRGGRLLRPELRRPARRPLRGRAGRACPSRPINYRAPDEQLRGILEPGRRAA